MLFGSTYRRLTLCLCALYRPEQHWGLMPLHAVCSTVRPASFFYGTGAHYGGSNPISFPQCVCLFGSHWLISGVICVWPLCAHEFFVRWLGQNSKQNKLTRQLGDVQIRMRLRVSGDKPEIRQQYIPALWPKLIKPLIDTGAVSWGND